MPQPTIDAAIFQRKWGGLPASASFEVALSACPSQAGIEAAMGATSVLTMASGDVGAGYKFFFYAQQAGMVSEHILVECNMNKAPCVATVTVKADNGSVGQQFQAVFEQQLRSAQ